MLQSYELINFVHKRDCFNAKSNDTDRVKVCIFLHKRDIVVHEILGRQKKELYFNYNIWKCL